MLKLSDAFTVQKEEVSLELQVLMLNSNPGYNEELKQVCKTLYDYVHYVEKVRTYAKTMEMAAAVDRAIEECVREGILAEFLKQHRAEAKELSIFEYDEERQMAEIREEGIERGIERGLKEGHITQIRKKSEKQNTPEQAAEALELEVAYVQKIMDMLSEFPDKSDREIAIQLIQATSD